MRLKRWIQTLASWWNDSERERLQEKVLLLQADLGRTRDLLHEALSRNTTFSDAMVAAEREFHQQMDAMHAREIKSLQMVSDFLAQQRWGLSIYGSAPVLPQEAEQTVESSLAAVRRLRSKDEIAVRNRKAAQDMKDYFQKGAPQ